MNKCNKVLFYWLAINFIISPLQGANNDADYNALIARLKTVGSDCMTTDGAHKPGEIDKELMKSIKGEFDSVATKFNAGDINNLLYLAMTEKFSNQKLNSLWKVGPKAVWTISLMKLKSDERENLEGLLLAWLTGSNSPLKMENYDSQLVRLTFIALGRVSKERGKATIRAYLSEDAVYMKDIPSVRVEEVKQSALEGYARIKGSGIRKEIESLNGWSTLNKITKNKGLDFALSLNEIERKYILMFQPETP